MPLDDLGIDSAWQTRIPQGWTTFPDGSIGPLNPTNPVDSAWPTRVLRPIVPGPLAPPAGGGAPSAINDSLSISPRAGPLSPYIHQGETIPPNAARGGPSIRGPGPTIDAEALKGGGESWGDIFNRLRGLVPGGLSPAAIIPALTAGGAAAGIWAEPRTPRVDPRISAAGSGGFDVEQPLGTPPTPMPHRPVSRPTQWPDSTNYPQYQPPVATAPPAAPAADPPPLPPRRPAAPQPHINPAQVDLGYYRAGVGNARTPVFVPQGQTQAPPIFRGPLATGGMRAPYY